MQRSLFSIIKASLLITLSCGTFVVSTTVLAAEYIGSDNCQDCHQSEYNEWLLSDHNRSMQTTSAESVLGDFDNVTVNFHGIATRFYQEQDSYLIETRNAENETEVFKVDYTFGYKPLQQYLVELDNGHIQAFSIAWDSRVESEGGQRWFHLQPDENITPEHPFYWTRHFQNWNSRCADCHSTNLQKNYSAEDHSYDTQWSEVNVACEACHGPGSDHQSLAGSGELSENKSGFSREIAAKSSFVFSGNNSIANNQGERSDEQIDSCAVCHSRRGVVGGYDAQKDYHDQYRLSLLSQGLYQSDGQIEDEVFVVGSFLQSKMHQAGVSCSDCHNPHTSQLKVTGNALCQNCHLPSTYDTSSHFKHAPQSAAGQCITCHMPEKTYMGVDDRADHSFSIPRPSLAKNIGASDVCSSCHQDWSDELLTQNYSSLFGEESNFPWAEANYEAQNLNLLALRDIMAVAMDSTQSAIRRASLLTQMASFPARVTFDNLQIAIHDSDPLVRNAAVEASSFLPPEGRLELLRPLFDDQFLSVRIAVANQLADSFATAIDTDKPTLLALFNEYETSLKYSEDSPGGQLNLGTFYYRRGDRIRVEAAYRQALEIEPGFVPALLNLADLRREQGYEEDAEELIRRALLVAPDSGAAHHALGLLLVRSNELDEALEELRLATQQLDATPRYSYVYAVGLNSDGNSDEAIEILRQSEIIWPNQPETLFLIIGLLDTQNRANELLPYLSTLSRLLPGNQDVRALVNKYTGR